MIISVAQQKGGVGKTTACIMLSQFFSYIKGYRVLVIDMDAQGNATSSFMDRDGTSLATVFIDKQPFETVRKSTFVPGLDIVVSDIRMEELETKMVSDPDGPFYLKDLFSDLQLASQYDIILIDTPPHLGRLTLSSLIASDYVLIPVEAKKYAAEGIGNLLTTIDEMKKPRLNPNLQILGAFINKYEDRTIFSRGILKSFKDQIGDILCSSHIRFNITVEECVAKQDNLYIYGPKANATMDFTNLGDELLTRLAERGTLMPEPSSL